MTEHVDLDYETFSEADLPAIGAWPYAEHETTEVLCFSWGIGSDDPQVWRYGERCPKRFYEAVMDGLLVWAWNANFERAVSEHVSLRQIPGFPNIRPEQWRDSMALAAMCAMPMSLKKCAHVLGGEQKDKEGERLLKLFSMPRKPTKDDPRTRVKPADRPEDYELLCKYCYQDVITERDVRARLPIHELPGIEQQVWTVDSQINSRGVLIDVPLVEGAIKINEALKNRELKRLQKLTHGLVETESQTARIKQFCSQHGCDIKSVAKEELAEALSRTDLPPVVRSVLEIRRDLSNSSTAKYDAMIRARGKDDRVRGTHMYGAAKTLRWGGRIIQPQNLPRPSLDVSGERDIIRSGVMEDLALFYPVGIALRDNIRHAIIADWGKHLLVADWSSIEARVLGWIADEPEYMKAYREKLDLYKVTASFIFGVPYKDVNKDQRFIGKESVLGLGYQMGAETFYENCRKKGYKGDRALIEKAHRGYRAKYKRIVQFWDNIEKAALAAAVTRKPAKLGRLRFDTLSHEGHDYFTIQLPSGRRLWYPGFKVEAKPNKWTGDVDPQLTFMIEADGSFAWVRSHTYGGRLAENVVQAIARDLLATALVRLDADGYNPVMHVHDEILCEVPVDGPHTLDGMIKIMLDNPPWADGLPLGAEGFTTTFYRK